MKLEDPAKRVKFCRIMKNPFKSFNNIGFSDKSNYHINGHVNNTGLQELSAYTFWLQNYNISLATTAALHKQAHPQTFWFFFWNF